jgi:hypothetical protein
MHPLVPAFCTTRKQVSGLLHDGKKVHGGADVAGTTDAAMLAGEPYLHDTGEDDFLGGRVGDLQEAAPASPALLRR